MHHSNKKLALVAAAVAGLLLGSHALAEEGRHGDPGGYQQESSETMPRHHRLPKYYPERFDRTGIMRSIVQGGKVMIGGVRYTVSPNVRVHTAHTRNASVYALNENTEVGIELDQRGKVITGIWVLPKGAVPQN